MHRPFSIQLQSLCNRYENRPVCLGDLIADFQGRGDFLLILLLTLPFLTPVPLPGLSIPFGIVIAVLGLRISTRRNIPLPLRLATRTLPPQTLPKVLAAATRIVQYLEKWVRPRWIRESRSAAFERNCAWVIAFAGLLLVLPLPIPFSNFFPASAVLLCAAAGLEHDGLFFVAGCLQTLASLLYLALIALGSESLLQQWLA